MTNRLRSLFIILCLLAFSLPVSAEVKIISLKHRPAGDLVPQVQKLLDEGEKVQGTGNHLVLVADGESLRAAEALIELLDRPLTTLIIRLRQEEQQQRVGEENSASLQLSTKSGSSLSASSARHLGNSSSRVEQSLRVLEGESGWLEVGRDIPYTSEWSAFSGETTGYSERIDYQRIAIGFLVQPVQIQNGQVLVEIMPQFSKLQGSETDPPEIRFSRLRTRMTIPLGEWYPLGKQIQQQNRVSRAIISWRSHSGQSNREIFIRIDPAAGFSP